MGTKINSATLRFLKQEYEKGVNGYLVALHNLWETDPYYGFWVGDKVGELYCYGDDIYINMDNIIYVVENNISMEFYYEYTEYCLKCSEYNFEIPKLPAYHKGCPLVPQETFDKLDALKRDLNECVEETKKNLNEQENAES